ncbi:hypothetical protein J6590_032270 [Homalodisca vitripennis]|nr:hypothetical protein J6590_032270 [Homalodisca vitripennis]
MSVRVANHYSRRRGAACKPTSRPTHRSTFGVTTFLGKRNTGLRGPLPKRARQTNRTIASHCRLAKHRPVIDITDCVDELIV